ncbi:TPA: hypothetical protein ACGPA6_000410 [Streptococcus suis]
MSNMTKLAWLSASVIKQGDVSSVFKLRLTTNDTAVLNGPATIQLMHKSKGMIEFSGEVVDNVISFQLEKALPIGKYIVEIEHAGYVFPSTNSVTLTVNENLGEFASTQAIELYGLKEIIKQAINEKEEQDIPDLLMFYNIGKV